MAGVASGTATMAGVQAIKGKRDQKKAEANRPEYNIDEYKQNLNQSQQRALQGMPAAVQQQYLDNLQQSTAYALQQTASRKGGLTGVAVIDQQQKQGLNNLAVNNAQAQMQNQDKLQAARSQYADYLGQKFQINESNPYYESNAQKQARNGALFQNLNNAAGFAAGGNFGGMKKSGPAAQNNQPNQVGMDNYYNPAPVQYMDPNQMYGVNQNTTPNPYGNQQEFKI